MGESQGDSELVKRMVKATAEMSRQELAELLGVDASYITHIRNGRIPTRVRKEIKTRIVAYLNSVPSAGEGAAGPVPPGGVSGYDAGYAAALLELIEADARRIAERAALARVRLVGPAAPPADPEFPAPILTPLSPESEGEEQRRA